MQRNDNPQPNASLTQTASLQGGVSTPSGVAPTGPVIGMIGRFQLLEPLGSGGFGAVYRAFDPQLQREVAIKAPRHSAELTEYEGYQFLHEGRAAARLEHPNLVPVYDAGREGNIYYIVSAYVRGASLRAQMQSAELRRPRAAAGMIRQIAAALDAAHAQGVIHRDIKPENILLEQASGKPLVADFGLARLQVRQPDETAEGAILGTPAYMSPEQAAGKSHLADARSDLWSLGVILYELLAQRRPFLGRGPELRTAIIEYPVKPLREVSSAIPADLAAICHKCLAKSPDLRYPTCRHLCEDLDRFLSGDLVSARRASWWEWVWRKARRYPVVAGSLAALALVIVVSGALLARQNQVLASAFDSEQQAKNQAQTSEQKTREANRNLTEQKALTEQHLRRSVQSLSQFRLIAFQEALAAGDPHRAILPLLEDLHEPLLDERRRQLHRIRLGVTLRYAPRLRQSWEGVLNCQVSPNGEQVLISRADGTELLSTASGQRIAALPGRAGNLAAGGGTLRPLAFAEDGQRFAVGQAGQVQLFRSSDGRAVGAPLAHSGTVLAIAFSHGGKQVATFEQRAPKAFSARVWDATTGAPASPSWEVTLTNPPRAPTLLFAADDQALLIGGDDEVTSWDPANGQPTQKNLGSKPQPGRAGYVSADGRMFAGRQLAAFHNHLREGQPDDNASGRFSGDGRWIAATFDARQMLEIWHVASGVQQATLPSPFVLHHTQAQFTAGNRRLLTTGMEDFALLTDLRRRQPLARLRMPHIETDDAQSSRNGKWLLTWSPYRRSARLWELASPVRKRLSGFPEIAGQTPQRHPEVTLHLDAERAAAHYSPGFGAWGQPENAPRQAIDRIWNLTTGEPLGEPGMASNAAARLPHSAPVVLSATGARVVDLERVDYAGPLVTHAHMQGVAASRDGRWLVTFVMSDPAWAPKSPSGPPPDMILWDVATGRELRRFDIVKDLDGLPRSASFTLNGERLLLGTGRRASDPQGRGRLAVWDVATGKLLHQPLEFPTSVMIRSAAPDGRRFAVIDADNRLSVVDVEAGKIVVGPTPLGALTTWIRFSPDGETLVVCGAAQARIVSARDGRDLTPPFGADCRNAKFSPDGLLVAVASRQSVQLFDAASGEAVSGALEHDDYVTDLAFTRDSRTLVTATSRGDLFSWSLLPDRRDLAVLTLEGELLTGRRLGASSVRLSPQELSERWDLYLRQQPYLPPAHYEPPSPLAEPAVAAPPAAPAGGGPPPPRAPAAPPALQPLTADDLKRVGDQVRLKEISITPPARAGAPLAVNCPFENRGPELVLSAEGKPPALVLVFTLGLAPLDAQQPLDPAQSNPKYPGVIVLGSYAAIHTRLAAGDLGANRYRPNLPASAKGKRRLWVYLELPNGIIIDSKYVDLDVDAPLF